MTISSSTRKAGPFTGNGVTVAYPFAFKVFSTADVLVVQALTSTGAETVQALTTNYTVALNADQNTSPGGTVTMLVAPPTGYTLTLTSQVDNLQAVDVTNGGGFYPKVLNNAFDKATIQIQQLAEKVSRALKLPVSSTASADLPTPVGGTVLGWNATGTALVNFVLQAGTSLVNLAASTGSSLIGHLPDGVGATPTTVQSYLRSIKLAAGSSISAAVNALPASGGIIYLDAGIFVSPYSVTPLLKDNVTFIGAGMPGFSGGYSSLSGGTIIQGTFLVTANHLNIRDLGIDSGLDVCNALFSGVPKDGLAIYNPGQVVGATPWEGIQIQNVTALAKDASTAGHAMLVENVMGAVVKNVKTVYGTNGFVLKGRNSLVDGVWARGCNTNAVIVKSDTYAPSQDNIVKNIRMGNITGTDTWGMRVQAASLGQTGLIIDGLISTASTCLSLETTGYGLADVTFSNIKGDGLRFYGVDIGGGVQRVAGNNIIINTPADATYGNGIAIDATSNYVVLDNVLVTNSGNSGIKNAGTNTLISNSRVENPGTVGFEGVGTSLMKLTQCVGTIGYAVAGSVQGGPSQLWTPVFSALTETPGTGTITKIGRYKVIDDLVHWSIEINLTGTASTACSGNVGGMPLGGRIGTVHIVTQSATPVSLGGGFSNGIGGAWLQGWTTNSNSILISGVYPRS